MSAPAPSNTPVHRIGEAARRCGVSAANIRYYESQGLLPAPVRSEGDYRLYSEADVHRLRFIRLCRAMDMSLDEVHTLVALDLNNKADCQTARTALNAHLQHVRERLAELRALERDLRSLRERCDGSDAQCHIIEALHARADEAALPPGEPPHRRRHL
ncbi:MAG TPA: Cd(II)/Pb(II)-responsive transcriptional regulator [Burkholderiaceae bacterium]|nr:Cd(II)/Pb(II)-responsive transcriptional regulator [Burkholderiaceae bacterium]